ncbi:MAG: phosphate ABC transporter substrate-binding protein [Thermodesulfobacteriota bacterium]
MKRMILAIAVLSLLAAPALAGQLTIKGSTTVLPIAQEITESYMKEFPGVAISLSGSGSGDGIKAIIDGTTDIADSSRFIKDSEVKMAVEKGAYPVPFAVAYDCIVPVVNPKNGVSNLTLAQLKDIYTGKIRNWKEVGGTDKKIVAISRDTSSGTFEVWEEKVMKKERVTPAAQMLASNGAVAQAVASNPYALGYVGLGYLNKSLKGIPVNGIMGSEQTTLAGTYPISRPLFMFTRGWPTGTTADFINYVLNPEKGQKLVKKAGFVPLY